MSDSRNSRLKRRKRDSDQQLSLGGKAVRANSRSCEPSKQETEQSESGIYGRNQTAASVTQSKSRHFRNSSSSLSVNTRRPSTAGNASVASSFQSNRIRPTSTSRIRIRRPLTRGSTSSSRPRSGSCTQLPDFYSQAEVHIVCAIGENLARETCVASLDAGSPVGLQVTKQGNGQTYAETLAYLEILRPHEILLNEGRRNSPLAKKVVQLYEGRECLAAADSSAAPGASTVVKFIPRSSFDQTKGAELLRRLARKETYDAALVEEYILLSSAHAVLHYTQRTLGSTFSRNCLDINVNSGGKNRMAIDRSSLLQLELLTNAKTGNSKNTLIETIDCTKTTVGSRLLRTNLIAPPSRIDTINARLDLVDTFLDDESFFYSVLEHLQSLPAVDKMLTNIAIVPRSSKTPEEKRLAMNARLASRGISALVYIKSTLMAVPSLTQALQEHIEELESRDADANNSSGVNDASEVDERSSLLIGLGGGEVSTVPPRRHHLLRAIIFALAQPELAKVCNTISEIFTDSTFFSRNANAMRHQECFALKSADDGMMDILRKAFLANVDDIYKKADEYAEVHGFHVTVRYTTTRGYFLSIPSEVASTLPDIFIQPTLRGKHIHCTTEEVHSLNTRSQDNVNDLLLMTSDRIQDVLNVARENYDALASLSDAVALLDLCHSFADKVTLSQLPWSRPVLHDNSSSTDNGITIRNGRFGIDVSDASVSEDGSTAIVPNDTYAAGLKNFSVVSGINGSGKSTYLKQIAIIVLLSHCGSYVPAEYASIPIRSRLCARMGTADDQENNISSFMLEMKETAFICNNASHDSLILLDELGRATSNEDGVAIAWAVSEYLLAKKAMTFFVSHYPQLCRLENVYPTVQNQHLMASVSSDDTNRISYTHKVRSGPCMVSAEYGVEMAGSCGWPEEVVECARNIERSLRGKLGQGMLHTLDRNGCDGGSGLSFTNKKLLKELSQRLVRLVQSEGSIDTLRQKLEAMRNLPDEDGMPRKNELLSAALIGKQRDDIASLPASENRFASSSDLHMEGSPANRQGNRKTSSVCSKHASCASSLGSMST
eukprot:scaffold2195_cov132-Cylindrotheca_fusiformis.AAC.11